MPPKNVELLSNPYGESAYETFRILEKAYVDKSLFIKELDGKNTPRYPVLLRPRCFGKSTFIQMLKCFYDISYKGRYEKIFLGTDIYKENLKSRNSYHVINFDFSKVNTQSSSAMLNSFFAAVSGGIDNFKRRYPDFIFEYGDLEKSDSVTLFNNFASAYADFAKTDGGIVCSDSGSYGRLYVMIDEYDNFANSVLSQDIEQFRAITGSNGFLKAFYSAIKAATADGDCIAKTFITGVSSVSLDSLTSGFNIALNIASDACFNEYAGFTESELLALIPMLVDTAKLGASPAEIAARMKPVYDGYCFSREADHTVFNSSMTLYYLRNVQSKGKFLSPEKCMDPASDHAGNKLKQLFDIAEDGLADEIIETYLCGDSFVLDGIAENINLNKSAKYNRGQLLSMLYYLGYLTIDRGYSDIDRVALKVPNLFMSKLFAACVADLRLKNNSAFSAAELNVSSLLEANDDIESFAESCTDFLSRVFSNQVLMQANEMALNLMLYTKLSSLRGISAEMQKSLRVSGIGENFADLVITANEGNEDECIYLIELKYLQKSKCSEQKISNLVNEASAQVLRYKSALDFQNKKVKAFVMVFSGPCCVHCKMQQ